MRTGSWVLFIAILLLSVAARAEEAESLQEAPSGLRTFPKAPSLWGSVRPVAFLSDNSDSTAPEPPRFHFTPSIDLIEVYDDNILLRSVTRESDYITRVRPGIEMAVEQERVKWLTDLKVQFEWFQQHPELSTFDRSQNLDTHLTIRPDLRWTFDFEEIYLHSRDPAEQEALGVLFQRTDFFINTISLKAAFRWTPRLTSEIEGINRTIQFKNPFLVDVQEEEVRIGFTYLVTPLDKVTPQYSYRNFYFERRGYTEAHTASLKVERRFTQTLTGRALIGGLLLVDRGTQKSDVLVGLGADQATSSTVIFHFDYSRDVAVVGGIAGAFVTNIFIGSVTAHVTASFDSTAALTASIQEARLTPHPNVNTWGGRVEERYSFVPWFKGFVSYSYTNQRQTGGRDIFDNRFMVGLTLVQTYPERP